MKKTVFLLVLIGLWLVFAGANFGQKPPKLPSKIGDAIILEFKSPFDRILIDTDEAFFADRENVFVSVGTNTKILDVKGKPFPTDAIRAGMKTEIKLESSLDPTNLIASQIKVKTNPENESVEVKGYLDKVSDEEAFIDGKTVLLMPNVTILGAGEWKNKKNFSSFKDVPLGSVLELKGARHADEKIYVTQAQVKPNVVTPIEKQLIQIVQKGLVLPPADKPGAGVQIGGQSFKVVENLELNTYITRVGYKVIPRYLKNLADGDPNKILFRFYVLDNDTPNAVALPDGSVFVNTGLLRKLDNEAQLAVILGHEIAHVSVEHPRRKLESAQKQAFWMGLAAAAAGAALGQEYGGLIGQLGFGLLSNKFSREMEDQADRIGLFYAYDAGYDIREGTKIWRKLIGDNYRDDSVGTFLYSDHPSLKSRLRNTKRELILDYQKADFSEVIDGREKYMENVGVFFGWVKPKPKVLPKSPTPTIPNKIIEKTKPKTKRQMQKLPAKKIIPVKPGVQTKKIATTAVRPKIEPGIRSVNFRNFSYPINRFCTDNVKGSFAKVVNGKLITARDKDYGPQGFQVAKIIYGDLNGDGKEEAVVSTLCGSLEPVQFNQSPFGNTYVYTMRSGNPELLSLFNDTDLEPNYKNYFREETFLFGGGAEKVLGNKLNYGAMVLEGMCCPKWNVEMVLRWDGSRFVLDGKPRRTPWR